MSSVEFKVSGVQPLRAPGTIQPAPKGRPTGSIPRKQSHNPADSRRHETPTFDFGAVLDFGTLDLHAGLFYVVDPKRDLHESPNSQSLQRRWGRVRESAVINNNKRQSHTTVSNKKWLYTGMRAPGVPGRGGKERRRKTLGSPWSRTILLDTKQLMSVGKHGAACTGFRELRGAEGHCIQD